MILIYMKLYIIIKSRITAAAVHKGTGSQTNNPTCSFKIGDINLFVKNVV